ncbi:hypothetical protein [Roseobacter sp. N2S]|uniref:hypothetical protein n=1 Tax=Roseobacter sp. N2S TaxID=2663844 RepID=UPI0028559186|nr:hypothetical protein [Roseobacter sp. N2S]MDR6265300.1 hypothetical protein [Roseobacter sp. N2S]
MLHTLHQIFTKWWGKCLAAGVIFSAVIAFLASLSGSSPLLTKQGWRDFRRKDVNYNIAYSSPYDMRAEHFEVEITIQNDGRSKLFLQKSFACDLDMPVFRDTTPKFVAFALTREIEVPAGPAKFRTSYQLFKAPMIEELPSFEIPSDIAGDLFPNWDSDTMLESDQSLAFVGAKYICEFIISDESDNLVTHKAFVNFEGLQIAGVGGNISMATFLMKISGDKIESQLNSITVE